MLLLQSPQKSFLFFLFITKNKNKDAALTGLSGLNEKNASFGDMFFNPRMAALKCQYAKTHTRLEFAPLMASSSLFHLFTLAAVLCLCFPLKSER